MITTIGFLVKGSLKQALVSAALYALGMTVGASLLGLALGSLGSAVRWLAGLAPVGPTLGAVLFISLMALIGGIWDLGLIPMGLPGCTRQLPRHYMQVLGPYKTLLTWGFYVGIGYRTRPALALYYVILAWAVLAGGPLWSALLLGAYGLSNGLLLIAEIVAVGRGARPLDGLLGENRNAYFFRTSGVVLLASSILLLTQCTMFHLIRG